MPVYNQIFFRSIPDGNQIEPAALAKAGPVLAVEVSIPTALTEKLTRENKPIPQPKAGLALIDTGATHSCVDDDVISQLGVNPILGVNIQAQQVNNQPIIALLGRDVLLRCVFIYNGSLGIYTLAF